MNVAGLPFFDSNPLAFHTVSFGPDGESMHLRRMAKLAEEVYGTVPRGPLSRPGRVPCGYTAAIDTVRMFLRISKLSADLDAQIRLAETFLTIANSLSKPRASLLRV